MDIGLSRVRRMQSEYIGYVKNSEKGLRNVQCASLKILSLTNLNSAEMSSTTIRRITSIQKKISDTRRKNRGWRASNLKTWVELFATLFEEKTHVSLVKNNKNLFELLLLINSISQRTSESRNKTFNKLCCSRDSRTAFCPSGVDYRLSACRTGWPSVAQCADILQAGAVRNLWTYYAVRLPQSACRNWSCCSSRRI